MLISFYLSCWEASWQGRLTHTRKSRDFKIMVGGSPGPSSLPSYAKSRVGSFVERLVPATGMWNVHCRLRTTKVDERRPMLILHVRGRLNFDPDYLSGKPKVSPASFNLVQMKSRNCFGTGVEGQTEDRHLTTIFIVNAAIEQKHTLGEGVAIKKASNRYSFAGRILQEFEPSGEIWATHSSHTFLFYREVFDENPPQKNGVLTRVSKMCQFVREL